MVGTGFSWLLCCQLSPMTMSFVMVKTRVLLGCMGRFLSFVIVVKTAGRGLQSAGLYFGEHRVGPS